VLVTAGVAVTVFPDVELKCAAGLQLYVDAPDAVSFIDEPTQILAELTVTIGLVFTVIFTVAVFVQPCADIPVTV